MANGGRGSGDVMRIDQLMLVGTFDGHWFTESQRSILRSGAAGRNFLAMSVLLASVAEATDGRH